MIEEYESLQYQIDNPKGTPLNYKKYKNYLEKPSFDKGQWLFKFENNYGASVIKRYGSYGYEKDKFELAVVKFNENNIFSLCYDTEITDDVMGYLSNEEVLEILEKIKNLKR